MDARLKIFQRQEEDVKHEQTNCQRTLQRHLFAKEQQLDAAKNTISVLRSLLNAKVQEQKHERQQLRKQQGTKNKIIRHLQRSEKLFERHNEELIEIAYAQQRMITDLRDQVAVNAKHHTVLRNALVAKSIALADAKHHIQHEEKLVAHLRERVCSKSAALMHSREMVAKLAKENVQLRAILVPSAMFRPKSHAPLIEHDRAVPRSVKMTKRD